VTHGLRQHFILPLATILEGIYTTTHYSALSSVVMHSFVEWVSLLNF
jgi:hypothetical protein